MFFEVEFPKNIAFASSGSGTTPAGGPSWSTVVNMGFSGSEQRNRNWATVRAKYQLDLVAQPLATYQPVLAFYYAVGGKADAFRFLDATDFSALAQPMQNNVTGLINGDGSTTIFQIQKRYVIGSGAAQRIYNRLISKPIMSVQTNGGIPITDFAGNQLTNTVKVYVAGVLKTLNVDYTIDATTGLVTFTSAPGNGVAVTADFQFHVPVRFDSDDWPAQVMESSVLPQGNAGLPLISVSGIQLIEVKILAGQSQG